MVICQAFPKPPDGGHWVEPGSLLWPCYERPASSERPEPRLPRRSKPPASLPWSQTPRRSLGFIPGHTRRV